MIIGLLIIAVIGLLAYVIFLKKQKIEEVKVNKEIQRQNLLIEAEVRAKQSELDKIKFSIDRENDILQSLTKSSEEMQKSAKEQAQKAYESEISALQELYKEEGARLDAQNQKKLQAILNRIKEEQDKLKQLEDKQLAYIRAQEREEEMKLQQEYYKLVLSEEDLSDILLLKDLQPKIRKKDSIDKVIYETYYRGPYNTLMSHLFGDRQDKVCGIYKITDQITGKSYIGQSVDIKERLKTHIKTGLSSGSASAALYQAMRKDKVHNFTFEILEEVPKTQLNERETYWINFYKTKDFGLNTTRGGS